ELSMLLALFQLVITDRQDARKQLEQRVYLSIFAFANVGGDRFGGLIGELAVRANMKADSRRKTFQQPSFGLLSGIWFAIDNQTQHTVFAAQRFISLDLFIDPFRNSRLRRTNDY